MEIDGIKTGSHSLLSDVRMWNWEIRGTGATAEFNSLLLSFRPNTQCLTFRILFLVWKLPVNVQKHFNRFRETTLSFCSLFRRIGPFSASVNWALQRVS